MAHALAQILVVLAASLVAVYGLGRLGLPSIVGFLVAGIAIGPKGLGFVDDVHLIEAMAEVGVVFLLFTIGLKFPIAELRSMRRLVFGAGALQMGLTVAACAALGMWRGAAPNVAVFVGILVAVSSTAILLKLLEDRAETHSPHGRLAIGVALFQDLCVVPAVLVTPMLAGRGGTLGAAATDFATSLGVVAAILVGGRLVLPRLLGVVARTRSREVFTLATILVVLGTASATGAADLSLALGALVAGVVLAESEYAHQVLSDVLPLRDLLASLFFVSVGMLVDVSAWVSDPGTTFGLAAAVIAFKATIVWAVARTFGLGTRGAILAGLALGQVGEFSFVLALRGSQLGILDETTYRQFLSVSVLSMVSTPFLLVLGTRIAGRPRGGAVPGAAGGGGERRGHAIVVGHGVAGRNVVSALRPLGVPVVVLELNPLSVREIRAAGGDAVYGDACSEDVLLHVGVRTARALVLTALDPVVMRHVVATARRLSPSIEILVRTQFVAEMAELHRLGANAVLPEEFEVSIALAGRAMRTFGATERTVARAAACLRGDGYSLVSEETTDAVRAAGIARVLAAAEVAQVPVPAASAGRSLGELALRTRTGATVVGLERGEGLIANPGAGLALAEGDVLVVLGTAAEVRAVRDALSV